MNIFDFFRDRKKQNSASIAKERLQIIVAHERGRHEQPDYLPQLQKDLLEVIRKYVPIEQDQIQVEHPQHDAGDQRQAGTGDPSGRGPRMEHRLRTTIAVGAALPPGDAGVGGGVAHDGCLSPWHPVRRVAPDGRQPRGMDAVRATLAHSRGASGGFDHRYRGFCGARGPRLPAGESSI